jgi:hypothetical protein
MGRSKSGNIRQSIALCLLGFVAVRANSWADNPAPSPRFFASETGRYGLKVIPPQGSQLEKRPRAQAALFRINEAGQEQTVWNGRLVNIPSIAIIEDTMKDPVRLVTFDTYGQEGHDHALVLYNEKGKVIADYKLTDFMPAESITHRQHTASSIFWIRKGDYEFYEDSMTARRCLVIHLEKWFGMEVDLDTGKLTYWKN